MEFGKQRKAFRTWKVTHIGAIKSGANSLYHELLDFAFDLGKTKFDLTNDGLQMMAGYGTTDAERKKFERDRDKLVQVGLIKYTRGIKDKKAPIYEIKYLYNVQKVSEERPNTVPTMDGIVSTNNTKTSLVKLSKDNNKDVEKVEDVVFVETSTDKKLSNYWQQIVMTTINGNQIQDLVQDAQDFGEHGVELVQRAIDITANAGAKSFKYYSAIVNDWIQKGVKTLGDVDMLAQQRKKFKQFSQGSKQQGNRRSVIEPKLGSVAMSETPEISDEEYNAAMDKLSELKTKR